MSLRIRLLAFLLIFIAGCDRAEDRAMKTLYDREYTFKIADFLKAARDGDGEAVRAFLEFGMEPDVEDGFGQRSLCAAAEGGQEEVVRILLAAGSEVEHVASEGETPLLAGAGSGNHRVVEALLSAGADPRCRNEAGWGTLAKAVAAGDPRSVERLVKEVPEQVNEALLIAGVEGEVEAIDILVAHGADIDTRSRDGSTPLIYAAMNDHADAVALLVHHGADSRIANREGSRAASFVSDPELKRLLEGRR